MGVNRPIYDRGNLVSIADLDYKIQGAIQAKATRIICPLSNALEYHNAALPRGRKPPIKVVGVRNIVELLQVSLIHPSCLSTTLYPAHEVSLPLSQGCYEGRSWGPIYVHAPGSPPKGWRQEVVCLAVPPRNPQAGTMIRAALCHNQHTSAFARAKTWAKHYSHRLSQFTPLRLDCANQEYDLIYSMPPTGTKKGNTPFSAVIHLATVSMITGWQYNDQVCMVSRIT